MAKHDDIVSRGQLNALITEFGKSLVVPKLSGNAMWCRLPLPPNSRTLELIRDLKDIWLPLEEELLMIASYSEVDSLTIKAFNYVQLNIPNLIQAPDKVIIPLLRINIA